MVQKGPSTRVDEWVVPYLDSSLDVFFRDEWLSFGTGPQRGKIVNLPNFISQKNAHDKEEFENCKKDLRTKILL
jgi:hypothetical protein